jgi:Glycosyl hydrolase family 26
VHKFQEIRQSDPSKQRRRLVGTLATSGVLAATIGFSTIASATVTHHQTRHHHAHTHITHLTDAQALKRLATAARKQHVRSRTTAISSHPALGTPVVIPPSAFSFGATLNANAKIAGKGPHGQTRPSLNLLKSLGRFSTTRRRQPTITKVAPHPSAGSIAPVTTTTTPPTPTPVSTPVKSGGGTTTTTTPPPATTTPPPTSSPGSLLLGAYMGAANPSGIAAFAAATKTDITVASEYLPPSGGWAGMDGTGGSLNWMFGQAWSGTPYTLSLGVPIIPTDAGGNPVGTLAAGATGAYNSYFVTLAQTMVAAGEGNAFLRLGWEFDGGWYAWNATTPAAEANFAAYFQQIVTAMRSVPGQSFRFVWNPDAVAFTQPGYNVELAYPGNSYVSDIGLDDYDQTWVTPQTPANEWNETSGPALAAAHAFAAAQGKPLAIDEWGIDSRTDGHGLGDDPLYVNNFTAFMKNPVNDVAYESYFSNASSDGTTVITSGAFPSALAALTAALG